MKSIDEVDVSIFDARWRRIDGALAEPLGMVSAFQLDLLSTTKVLSRIASLRTQLKTLGERLGIANDASDATALPNHGKCVCVCFLKNCFFKRCAVHAWCEVDVDLERRLWQEHIANIKNQLEQFRMWSVALKDRGEQAVLLNNLKVFHSI